MNHEDVQRVLDDVGAEIPELERWGVDCPDTDAVDMTELMQWIEQVTQKRVARSPQGSAIMASTHLDGIQKLTRLAPVYHRIYARTKQEIFQERGITP